MGIFIMLLLQVNFCTKDVLDQQRDLFDGEDLFCVNRDGLVYKLIYKKETNKLVSLTGKEYEFDDFIEFARMYVE